MATHSPFWVSWAVKTSSPGHMATHSSSWISWAVQDSITGPYGFTFFFLDIMGSQDSVTGPYGHIFSFSDIMGIQGFVTSTVYGDTISFSKIMGSQYSVHRANMATHSPSPISWAVKNPSLVVLFMATPISFFDSWLINTPSPGHMATHSPSRYHGQSRSVISRTVYGHTISFSILWVVNTPVTLSKWPHFLLFRDHG
ncbi:hypothetical protein BgiBS90_038356 [Biomphalaria glabrata]|nr:hypothetical protein BgiBS90_038356 [Biomphalaria glabrata]